VSTRDTFRGAKSGLVFLFAYQNAVAQEIGLQRAMALNTQMVQALGTAQGKDLGERIDVRKVPPQLAASLAGEFLERTLGIDSRGAEGSGGEAVIHVGRCPVYEAAEALGLDNAAIEALCRTGSIPYMDALVKQFNPDLGYHLSEFRTSATAPCLEEIAVDGR
jgi:hypothetical protein